ncbi:MAG: hypothetical protein WD275_08005 [Rhodothermales bacterium]
MGQQQLLLLVLGIVIVGLAVVVGIQAFGENQKKANADALVNDAIRIASDAQAWKLKPLAFGGGANGDANDFAAFSFEQVGYTTGTNGAGAGEYGNLNGVFSIAKTADLLTITAINASNLNQVVVEVDGTTTDNIETTVSNYTAL